MITALTPEQAFPAAGRPHLLASRAFRPPVCRALAGGLVVYLAFRPAVALMVGAGRA
jgi:hypothetical protein